MTRLCAIGTSQLGCLKAGWDAMRASRPADSVTFFGVPNHGVEERLANVRLHEGRLVPTAPDVEQYFRITSGGQSAIDLSAYDAFLVIGCGTGLLPLLDIYAAHRCDQQRHDAPHTLLTPACYEATVRQLFSASLANRLASAIRKGCGKPVLLTPDPRPSARLLQAPPTGNAIWDHYIRLLRQAHGNGDHESLDAALRMGITSLSRPGVSILDPAGPMREQAAFTPHAFCENSPWLQNGRFEASPREDYFHMNGRYGAEILRASFDLLARDAQPGRAQAAA